MKQSFTLDHSNADLLVYMVDGMLRIHSDDGSDRSAAGQDSYAQEVGTTEDRLFRAIMMISARMVSLLPPVIEATFNDESLACAVWVYEYLDYAASGHSRADCQSLPAHLWRWLDANPDHWISSAEGLREDRIPLESVLSDWCKTVGLKVEVSKAA